MMLIAWPMFNMMLISTHLTASFQLTSLPVRQSNGLSTARADRGRWAGRHPHDHAASARAGGGGRRGCASVYGSVGAVYGGRSAVDGGAADIEGGGQTQSSCPTPTTSPFSTPKSVVLRLASCLAAPGSDYGASKTCTSERKCTERGDGGAPARGRRGAEAAEVESGGLLLLCLCPRAALLLCLCP
eukprot:1557365-Rhodomonas_salina.1